MKNHQLDLMCHSSLQRPSDISPLYRLSGDIQSQTLHFRSYTVDKGTLWFNWIIYLDNTSIRTQFIFVEAACSEQDLVITTTGLI